jgi:hypothetical protein
VACGTTCDPCPPPLASISTAQQRMCVLVYVEVEPGVCEHRGACCTSTTMFLVGGCGFFSVFSGREACGTTCDPCPPSPASISTAQQRVYLFAFIVVERGVCEHRGACCTSTTVCWVGSCAFCLFHQGERRVAPCVTHARLLPSPYRQRSSVCMCLYLSRWSGGCAHTGAHAAWCQPCFFEQLCFFFFFFFF